MNVGFSASQEGISYDQITTLTKFLDDLYDPGSEFHHGNCIKGDEMGAMIARFLGYTVVAHPGDNPLKQSKLDIYHRIEKPMDNLERNKVIVTVSEVMVTCPISTKEVRRSGTWATIREARDRQKKPTTIIWRDGTITRENYGEH